MLNLLFKNIKIRFLQGIFDSELSNITRIKNKSAYQSLKFYHCKIIDKTDDGIFFLNQIKKLLKDFGIITSKISLDRKYTRSRDNLELQQLYFVIYANYINLYNFIIKIGFLYNSKRRMSALVALRSIESLASLEEKKIRDYPKVIRLKENGWSSYKIAKKLGLRNHIVKQWLFYKTKPRLYKYRINNS